MLLCNHWRSLLTLSLITYILISSSTIHKELSHQVWWISIKCLVRYFAHKVFIYHLIWSWPLSIWPWIYVPNILIYSSYRVTTSSLVKIRLISCEILCTQAFCIWPNMTLTFKPMTLSTWPVHLLCTRSYPITFFEDSSNSFRYHTHKIFIYDPIWPWPLTLKPWVPNQFIYPS